MFKSQGRNDQKVRRCNSIGMNAQEGLPTLRRRPSSPKHVLRDCRLVEREAQFQQLAMDTRRTPKRVLFTHTLNKIPQFAIDFGPGALIAGLPAPPGPKIQPVRANYGLRMDDRDRICNTRKEPVQPDEQDPVAAR